MRPFHLVSPLVAVLIACPPLKPALPDGGEAGPNLTSVSPLSGSLGGGIELTLNGSNFATGARVFLGALEASPVTFVSSRKLTARTPASPVAGAVDVRVQNPDGRTTTLGLAFVYEPTGGPAIDESVVMNPASAADETGAATVAVTIEADVSVPGVTAGTGAGAGVKAQVGFAATLSTPLKQSDFTWQDATYKSDVDGPAAGDKSRDRYQGSVSLPGATGSEVKAYALAARFSVDQGASWVLADKDGSANGADPSQLPRFRVSGPTVDWCKLGGQSVQPRPDVALKVGQTGPVVHAQVYRKGVTDATGQGTNVRGQLGYGAAGAPVEAWTWTDASYNVDTGGGANDEYQLVLPTPGVGTYLFAYRFQLQGGPYRYCDADGSDVGGFTTDQAGQLSVTAPTIERCRLQHPPTLEARTGLTTDFVYGQVWAPSVTDAVGAGAGLAAQLGFGAPGTGPTDASWQWTSATFNVDVDSGKADEFRAALAGPAAGSYAYAFRFQLQGGAWVNCDLDGSENGFSNAQAGALTSRAVGVDGCQLVGPSTATGVASRPTTAFTAKVRAMGVTDGAGQGVGVTAELGYGPSGTSPPAGWTWSSATYDTDVDNGAADQYQLRPIAPSNGNYEVAFRFRYQSGPWLDCDLDGSANGYQVAQAAKLTVAPPAVSSCKLQWVSLGSVGSGHPVTAYGRVFVPGITDDVGQGAGLRAQLGVGTAGDDASSSASWGWQEARFFGDVAGGGDEYALDLRPAYTGTRAVSFRVSLDNGASFTYCDLNGSDVNGYEVGQQHALNVTPHGDLDWCVLQHPSTLTQASAASTAVYGRVYEPGLTPDAGSPVLAALGYGRKVEDPGLAWSWIPATFYAVYGNDNEYQAMLAGVDAGNYHYAFRFSGNDGGSYCYADLNGAGGTLGFNGESGSAENLGVATVTP